MVIGSVAWQISRTGRCSTTQDQIRTDEKQLANEHNFFQLQARKFGNGL